MTSAAGSTSAGSLDLESGISEPYNQISWSGVGASSYTVYRTVTPAGGTPSTTGNISGTILQPSPPTVTAQGGSGTSTWSYVVVAVLGTGSVASFVGSCTNGNSTLSSIYYNELNWSSVTGASSYNVYRVASGGTPASLGKIANVSSGTTYNDQGATGDGTAPINIFNDVGVTGDNTTPAPALSLPTIQVLAVSDGIITSVSLPSNYLFQMPLGMTAAPPSLLTSVGGNGSGATFSATWRNSQQNIVIQDLVLDCTNQNTLGVLANQIAGNNLCAIEFFNADYVDVYRCKIIRAYGNGVVFGSYDPSRAYPATGCRVEACVFDTCVGGPLHQYQSSSALNGVTGDCIQMGSTLACIAKNNIAIHPGGPFLDIDNSDSCIVEGNYIGGYNGSPVGSCPSCTQVKSVSLVDAGSNYNLQDLVFLSGGVFTPGYYVPATLVVTSTSSGPPGPINGFTLINGGGYQTVPSGSSTTTTGSGSGAELSVASTQSTAGFQQTVGTIHSDYGLDLCTIRGNTFNGTGGIVLNGNMTNLSSLYTPAPGPQNCIVEGNIIYYPTTGLALSAAWFPAPTVTPEGGGTANTTWSYVIIALNGQSTPATTAISLTGTIGAGNNTLSDTTYNQIAWPSVVGAASYNIYRMTANGSLLMGEIVSAIPQPSAPGVTVMGIAGSTTYAYAIVASVSNPSGQVASFSGACTNGNASLSGTNYNEIYWSAVPHATEYFIYRTINGANNAHVGFLASVSYTTLAYNDNGTINGNGAIPAFVYTDPGTATGNGITPVWAPTVSVQGSVGTTNYYYQIVAVTSTGITPSSLTMCTTGNATLSEMNYNEINWPSYPGALEYQVYRTYNTSSSPPNIGKIANVTGTSYKDQGGAADGTTVPGVLIEGALTPLGFTSLVNLSNQPIQISLGGGSDITAERQSGGNGSLSAAFNVIELLIPVQSR